MGRNHRRLLLLIMVVWPLKVKHAPCSDTGIVIYRR